MSDTKAPERVWLDPICGTYTDDDYCETDVEYVRTDLYKAAILERDRLRTKVERLSIAIETAKAQAQATPLHPFCAMVISTCDDALKETDT